MIKKKNSLLIFHDLLMIFHDHGDPIQFVPTNSMNIYHDRWSHFDGLNFIPCNDSGDWNWPNSFTKITIVFWQKLWLPLYFLVMGKLFNLLFSNQAHYWKRFAIVPFCEDLRELQRAVGHGGDEVERGAAQVSRVHELIQTLQQVVDDPGRITRDQHVPAGTDRHGWGERKHSESDALLRNTADQAAAVSNSHRLLQNSPSMPSGLAVGIWVRPVRMSTSLFFRELCSMGCTTQQKKQKPKKNWCFIPEDRGENPNELSYCPAHCLHRQHPKRTFTQLTVDANKVHFI